METAIFKITNILHFAETAKLLIVIWNLEMFICLQRFSDQLGGGGEAPNQKARVMIGYLKKKIKTNSLKREEPSWRILMSKPILVSERNLAEWPEMQHNWEISIDSLQGAQHLSEGCPGVHWGSGCWSHPLFQKYSVFPSVHKKIRLPRYKCAQKCSRHLCAYTDL